MDLWISVTGSRYDDGDDERCRRELRRVVKGSSLDRPKRERPRREACSRLSCRQSTPVESALVMPATEVPGIITGITASLMSVGLDLRLVNAC